VAVSAEQLALINKFALAPLAAEQVYVRAIHLCHNAIDLDRERFSEALLTDFLASHAGKSFICSHKTDTLGFGILFDGEILKMPPAEASALLGEELNFPAGVKEAQLLKLWFYIPLAVPVNGKQVEMNQELVANIEAGVYRHVSIGFSASGCAPVVDEKSGETLYWEWKAPGLLREASMVYLGAQPGATTAAKSAGVEACPRAGGEPEATITGKSAGVDDMARPRAGGESENKTSLEKKTMSDKIKALLGLGADADHAAVEKGVGEKLTRLAYLESIVAPLEKAFGEAEPSAGQVMTMVLEAADGRTYKSMLVDESLKLERVSKRLADDEKSIAARKGMLIGRPVADLLFDLDSLRKGAAALAATGITGSDPNAGRTEAEARKTFIKQGGDK
jgi:hypothetical protein